MQYPSASGYSLWLMPDSETMRKLHPLMQRWANYFGTPVFDPHITILGSKYFRGKQIEPIYAILPQPIQLTLTKPLHGTSEFMQIFFPFAEGSLIQLHILYAQLYQQKPDSHYFPHWSIWYGTCPASEYAQGDKQWQLLIESLAGKRLIRDTVILYDVNGPYPDRKPLSLNSTQGLK